jgi:hypothetical protein
MCSTKYLIGLGAIIVLVIADLIYLFDITKTVEFTDKEKPCKMIPGTDTMGIVAEDIMMLTDTLILAPHDDRTQLGLWANDGSAPRLGGPKNTPDGALFLIEMADDPVVPRKVEIKNWPRKIAFHPHGIDILRTEEKTLIYIVNHAFSKGGERIEVIEFKDNEFYYVRSFVNEMQINREAMGTLNDVVAWSEEEFYVTQFMPLAKDREWNGDEKTILHSLKEFGTLLASKYNVLSTPVWWCKTRNPS